MFYWREIGCLNTILLYGIFGSFVLVGFHRVLSFLQEPENLVVNLKIEPEVLYAHQQEVKITWDALMSDVIRDRICVHTGIQNRIDTEILSFYDYLFCEPVTKVYCRSLFPCNHLYLLIPIHLKEWYAGEEVGANA
jgi:hypothetical protein